MHRPKYIANAQPLLKEPGHLDPKDSFDIHLQNFTTVSSMALFPPVSKMSKFFVHYDPIQSHWTQN